jgi:hypothetical protein
LIFFHQGQEPNNQGDKVLNTHKKEQMSQGKNYEEFE